MTRVLNIEDSNVIGRGDDGAVAGIGHELDREYVGFVTRFNGRGKVELRSRRVGMVRVDVDAVIIGPGRKQTTRFGPTGSIRLLSGYLATDFTSEH